MTAIHTPEVYRFELERAGMPQPMCAYCGQAIREIPCVLFRDAGAEPGRSLVFHTECAKMAGEILVKEAKEAEAG